MLVLIAFGIGSAALTLASGAGGSMAGAALSAGHELVWTTVGSAALGVCLGLLLDLWSRRRLESGEMMILTIGVVLIAVGAARALDLSPLFVTLTVGAVVANASHRSDELLEELRRADPPLYAAFFVLAGAELRPSMLASIGVAGAVYVLARSAGKLGGATMAAARLDLPAEARRSFGLCLLSSSSLAIGLTIQIREEFPEIAPTVTGIVLAAVIVFEIVGPLLCRFALIRAGEAQPR
jgi:Kef-type K+ transport system membrane component KefB